MNALHDSETIARFRQTEEKVINNGNVMLFCSTLCCLSGFCFFPNWFLAVPWMVFLGQKTNDLGSKYANGQHGGISNMDREQCFCGCGKGQPLVNIRRYAKLGVFMVAAQAVVLLVYVILLLAAPGSINYNTITPNLTPDYHYGDLEKNPNQRTKSEIDAEVIAAPPYDKSSYLQKVCLYTSRAKCTSCFDNFFSTKNEPRMAAVGDISKLVDKNEALASRVIVSQTAYGGKKKDIDNWWAPLSPQACLMGQGRQTIINLNGKTDAELWNATRGFYFEKGEKVSNSSDTVATTLTQRPTFNDGENAGQYNSQYIKALYGEGNPFTGFMVEWINDKSGYKDVIDLVERRKRVGGYYDGTQKKWVKSISFELMLTDSNASKNVCSCLGGQLMDNADYIPDLEVIGSSEMDPDWQYSRGNGSILNFWTLFSCILSLLAIPIIVWFIKDTLTHISELSHDWPHIKEIQARSANMVGAPFSPMMQRSASGLVLGVDGNGRAMPIMMNPQQNMLMHSNSMGGSMGAMQGLVVSTGHVVQSPNVSGMSNANPNNILTTSIPGSGPHATGTDMGAVDLGMMGDSSNSNLGGSEVSPFRNQGSQPGMSAPPGRSGAVQMGMPTSNPYETRTGNS